MATALHRGVHAAGSSTSRSRLPQRSLIGRPVPAPSVSIRGITTSWPKWPVMPSPPQYGDYDVLDVSSAMSSYPDPLPVPDSIRRPPYVPANFFTAPIWEHEETTDNSAASKIKLGTRAHERVRAAGQAAAEVLAEVGKLVRPGITTAQLDEAAHAAILRRGAYPSPLGYSHFPKSCTTSVNNVVARELTDLHRPLLSTDIINLDITLFLNGYHGDTSATFVLPETDKQGRDLVEATREALEIGIRTCGPGKLYRGIGRAIDQANNSREFARKHGYGINTQFSGHGIGQRFHQEPWILHHQNTGTEKMSPGDCFTIEPPLVQGMKTRGTLWEDGWTVTTDTGARSAQFEHQVLITHDGVEVLTRLAE
ncbi:uncharacterized protein EHS24_007060 [Apiotrichum porosum]|uniref:Methionine aminopeptidase n=1 Tax=Apiotrichum porosum TaxID=105984 RepID=A0A427XX15_9TREE|nr:uncharacterized protein EHS24_007060 [Apiotrichum porosum]RSH83380.1 hypothetical protein EHS24_007060 [Apiotrichum porosum]